LLIKKKKAKVGTDSVRPRRYHYKQPHVRSRYMYCTLRYTAILTGGEIA